jgi:hypothetical protein
MKVNETSPEFMEKLYEMERKGLIELIDDEDGIRVRNTELGLAFYYRENAIRNN